MRCRCAMASPPSCAWAFLRRLKNARKCHVESCPHLHTLCWVLMYYSLPASNVIYLIIHCAHPEAIAAPVPEKLMKAANKRNPPWPAPKKRKSQKPHEGFSNEKKDAESCLCTWSEDSDEGGQEKDTVGSSCSHAGFIARQVSIATPKVWWVAAEMGRQVLSSVWRRLFGWPLFWQGTSMAPSLQEERMPSPCSTAWLSSHFLCGFWCQKYLTVATSCHPLLCAFWCCSILCAGAAWHSPNASGKDVHQPGSSAVQICSVDDWNSRSSSERTRNGPMLKPMKWTWERRSWARLEMVTMGAMGRPCWKRS